MLKSSVYSVDPAPIISSPYENDYSLIFYDNSLRKALEKWLANMVF